MRPERVADLLARSALAILLPLVVSPLASQGSPTIALRAPQAEHPEPLSEPTALLELRDGRVLVADAKERLLYLFDFTSGTATQVSRQGRGPLEYLLPSALFASGDSIIMIDMLQQRMLILDARGAPKRTHVLVAGGDAMSAIMKIGSIVAIDAKGRFYSDARGISIVAGKMPVVSDTVALVRWTALGVRGDTLATRLEPRQTPKMGGNATDGLSLKLPMNAFQPHDAWAVFPDGRVAVVRAADYHTEWVAADGRRTAGAPLRFTPIPISDADKERARKAAREAAEQGLKLGASMAAGSGQKLPKIAMEVEEPPAWPRVKPPFSAVRAAADGTLWVMRTSPEASRNTDYDVLATDGTIVRRVRTPADVTLLGFGKGVLYGVRKDQDDLRYLQRYRLP